MAIAGTIFLTAGIGLRERLITAIMCGCSVQVRVLVRVRV